MSFLEFLVSCLNIWHNCWVLGKYTEWHRYIHIDLDVDGCFVVPTTLPAPNRARREVFLRSWDNDISNQNHMSLTCIDVFFLHDVAPLFSFSDLHKCLTPKPKKHRIIVPKVELRLEMRVQTAVWLTQRDRCRWQAQVSFSLGSLVQFDHWMSRCRSLFSANCQKWGLKSNVESVNVAKRDHRSFDKFDHGSHLNTTSASNTRIREQRESCHDQQFVFEKMLAWLEDIEIRYTSWWK